MYIHSVISICVIFQIPKGFPYFAVDFGMQGGFAHVIEDERQFPKYFGKVCICFCVQKIFSLIYCITK